MICVKFGGGDTPDRFEISGHSGYAEEGSDIVCSAVSAMSQLVINTITEVYGEKSTVYSTEAGSAPHISFKLLHPTPSSLGLIQGFKLQLEEFQSLYPEFLNIQ